MINASLALKGSSSGWPAPSRQLPSRLQLRPTNGQLKSQLWPPPPSRQATDSSDHPGEDSHRHPDSSFPDSGNTTRPMPLRTPVATITREAAGAAASLPEVTWRPPQNVNNNNNNPTWAAWLGMQQPFSSQRAGLPGASPGLSGSGEPSIEDQVRYIMESTPHQLTGKVPSGGFHYPYKYVTRGPEKRRLSFNNVTLAEHIWGMFRMLDDECTDPSIKPYLLSHMKEVAEDACEYEWGTHVRRWSEEIFNMVAEKRLPEGWKSSSRIQNLRTGMSRVDSARLALAGPKDFPTKRFPAQPHASDSLKGGPPCASFNSAQGCSLHSGHLLNGVKQTHVCSYCLANTAAAHPHPEARCRTKQRHTAAHF